MTLAPLAMQNAFALLAAALVLAPAAAAQGAAAVLEANGHTWLDQNSRLEYPADLDGDGRMELVGWWSYWSDFSPVQVFFWTQDPATGTWSEKEDTFGSGNSAYLWGTATGVGDFDGDGKDEVALCHHWAIEVFEPNGIGEPTRIVNQTYVPNLSALDRDVAVADFDEDGRDDLALVAGGTLYLYLSVPGGFTLSDTYALGPNSGGLAVDAADGAWDGEIEVIVLQQFPTSLVQVFGVDHLGQLRDTPPYALALGAGSGTAEDVMLTSGDVDGDGDTDLVCFGAAGQYQVLRRGGPGYVVEAPRVGGPATALADIDMDGDLDGICCGSGSGSFVYNTQPSTFEICVGDGTGNFDTSVQFAGLGGHHVAGAIDFDGDGDLDVLGGRVVLFGKSSVAGSLCAGAQNSTGSAAHLTAAGSQSLTAGGLQVSATGLPAGQLALLISARLLDAGDSNDTPFYDGTLCLRPMLGRLRVVSADAGGAAHFGGPADWNTTPWGIGYAPGTKYGYQVWYRDPAAGGSGANLSDAITSFLVL
ncbi:MAG: VCBS repeat-containing protein [Planctomycetes bacterium]|nr:VCBS repeat-containing protein [Planctomycetota bacterium]